MDISLGRTPVALTSPTFVTAERRRAAIGLLVASLAGAATQALFWRVGLGLNFFVWDVAVLAVSVHLFRPAKLRLATWGAIAACVLLGFSVVRYENDWSLAIAVPVTLALLALLPFLLSEPHTLADLSRLPSRAIASLRHAPGAAAEVARLPGIAAGGEGQGILRGIARGLLFGIPTAGVFTLLLATDTDFARSLSLVRQRMGDVALFLCWSGASAAGYLLTHALHRRQAARAAGRAEIASPYRATAEPSSLVSLVPSARVSVVTWAMVVGQVALVFALFVGANVRHLFGGHALVRAPGTLTYAAYLHAGFAELLFATILSVCLVLAGHTLLRARGAGEAGPVPGGKVLAFLEGTLLVLTGITVVSCWQRLRIYEDAYGASNLRLGVAFVEVAILGVLALTLGKVIARGWTGHGGAVLAFATLLAVVASGFNADAYVARTNLDRATRGRPLDVAYLTSLSGDARAALDHPFVRADPALGARLEAAMCRPRSGGVRAYRGLGRCTAGAK